MMTTRGNHRLFLPLLILGVAGTWHQTWAAPFLCRNGEQTRRVEVSPGAPDEKIACEVRYWRNASIASDGEVLWQATQDEDYCEARARELLKRLQAGGWACAEGDQPARSEPMPEANTARRAASPPTAPMPAREPTLREARVLAEPAPGAPPAAPPGSARQPAAAPAGRPPAPAAGNHNAAILDQVVAQTLRSVQQLYGGDFRAGETAFGDLDGDGREDAAILVTYQADRDDYVQYLVAYLFDGKTYQSTATKNLGGRFLDVQRAEVHGIVDQSIVVVLQALDGDATCCEARETAFALKDGQLVEVEKPAGR